MADPTSRVSLSLNAAANRNDFLVKNGDALVQNGLVGIRIGTGDVKFLAAESDLFPAGILLDESRGLIGSDGKVTGDGTIRSTQINGVILEKVSVTGVTGAGDIGKPVYATDGQTMTLTRSDKAQPIGIVIGRDAASSGTTCNVYLYSIGELSILSLAHGGTVRRKELVAYVESVGLNNTGNFEIITDLPLIGHGKIVGFDAVKFSDGGSTQGSHTVTLDIGAVAVTGGSVTIAFGDTTGALNSATITAANEYNDGDTLSIKVSSGGTAFDAGGDSFGFFLTFEHLLGG